MLVSDEEAEEIKTKWESINEEIKDKALEIYDYEQVWDFTFKYVDSLLADRKERIERERDKEAVITWIDSLLAIEPSINKDTPAGYWRGYDKAANDILTHIRNPQGGR